MYLISPRFRKAALATLLLPLFSLGTCSNIAIESAVDGFFNALTSVLDAQLSQDLSSGDGDNSGSTGASTTNP